MTSEKLPDAQWVHLVESLVMEMATFRAGECLCMPIMAVREGHMAQTVDPAAVDVDEQRATIAQFLWSHELERDDVGRPA